MTEAGPDVDTGSEVGPDGAAGGEVVPAAIRTRAHWLVFFAIAGAVIIVDQVAKAWLVANVSPGEVVELVGDWVRLIFSQNSGALFGLFRDNAVLFGIVSL